MIDWLVVRAEHRDEVGNALPRAWRGGEAHFADLAFPRARVTFVWPSGASARRAARWPDLLTDWRDIYEDALFPGDAIPVLAEEAAGLGAEPLIVHAELGLATASTGWYRKGNLAEYEHVGAGAQVSWNPEDGLGRPFDGTSRTMSAMAARRFASLMGAAQTAATLERLERTAKAAGEALLLSAFLRMLGDEPPPMDQLAGQVASAPVGRVRLPG
jgi:hypothetical protein